MDFSEQEANTFTRDIGAYNWEGSTGTAVIANDTNFYLRLRDDRVVPLDDVTIASAVANDGVDFISGEISDAVIDLLIAKREFAAKCEQEEKNSSVSLFPGIEHEAKIDDLLTTHGTIGSAEDWVVAAGNGAFYIGRDVSNGNQLLSDFESIVSSVASMLRLGWSGKLADALDVEHNEVRTDSIKSSMTTNDGNITLSIENNGEEYGYKIALSSVSSRTIYAALNLSSVAASNLLNDMKALGSMTD